MKMKNFYNSLTPKNFQVLCPLAQLRRHYHCRTPEHLATKAEEPSKLVNLLKILGRRNLISLMISSVIVLVIKHYKEMEIGQKASRG